MRQFILLSVLCFLSGCNLETTDHSISEFPTTTPIIRLAGIVPHEDKTPDPQLTELGIQPLSVELETNEPRAPFEGWPAGPVYQMAAEYYAILHDDYDVSVGEVLSSGLWPYRITPHDADMEARIHGGTLKVTFSTTPPEKTSFIDARHEILLNVLGALYGPDTVVPIQPPDKLEKDMRFWQNPRLGRPMELSTQAGDYSEYTFGCLPPTSRFAAAKWIDMAWKFPAINLFDTEKYRYIGTGNTGSSTGASKRVSEVEFCCFLRHVVTPIPQNTNYNYPLSCQCGTAPPTYCNLSVKITGTGGYRNDYTLINGPCDAEPPDGFAEVDCPVEWQDNLDLNGNSAYAISHNC